MCKAPKPPPIKKPDKPEFLHNPFLDAAVGGAGAVDQLRQGRSSLRIDIGSGLGIIPQQPQPLNQPPSIAAATPPALFVGPQSTRFALPSITARSA